MRFTLGMAMAAFWAAGLSGCVPTISPEARADLVAAGDAYDQGDDASAVRAASRFLAVHPRVEEAGEAFYVRGMAQRRRGKTAEAAKDLAAAATLAKRKDLVAAIHLALGNLAYDGGDMASARLHYEATLERVPRQAPPADQALYRLGCVLQRQGKWAQADLYFDRLIHLFEGDELARRAESRIRATRWSIQAAAYARPGAERPLVDRLRQAGLPARTDQELRQGRMMQLVRVGVYATFRAAEGDLPKVKRIQSDAFITPAR